MGATALTHMQIGGILDWSGSHGDLGSGALEPHRVDLAGFNRIVGMKEAQSRLLLSSMARALWVDGAFY